MQKDEHYIGYTDRYIVLPKTYAIWDTQTNCWVTESENADKQQAHEMANKFNSWNNPNK